MSLRPRLAGWTISPPQPPNPSFSPFFFFVCSAIFSTTIDHSSYNFSKSSTSSSVASLKSFKSSLSQNPQIYDLSKIRSATSNFLPHHRLSSSSWPCSICSEDAAVFQRKSRNPKNPSYTVMSSWLSRMQIVTDLAHNLDYIHHCSSLDSTFIHNHIKSSSIIVSE
ncbi:hypothetical protein DVH24_034940 [Malus domestica]|uniref:Protein kinase domain-containing protein n=1 Tax=Malus domestica TaxID=3750 RepID=A0A498IEU5_MALDO|nr:hypothetical protein DVH24_034940 [Malus domestica]